MGIQDLMELAAKKGIQTVPIKGYKPSISIGKGGASVNLSGVEDKDPLDAAIKKQQLIKGAIDIKKSQKEANKAPFQIMSADDRKFIQEIKNIPSILQRTQELAENVPENRVQAGMYKAQMNTPIVNMSISQEQRALKTNLELLIQTVIKSFQGARPSDKDQEIIARALNAMAEGRGNFKVALSELGKLAARRAESFSETSSKGWGIDKPIIDDLIDLQNIKKMGEAGLNTTKGIQSFIIKGKTYNIPDSEVVDFKKEMGIK